MTQMSVLITPRDQGTRMRLEDFARAEGEPGHLYELAKGVIQVVEVPSFRHGQVVDAIDAQLQVYRVGHPGVIEYLAGGAECALRLPGMQTERHPDRAVYLTPPPDSHQPWDRWAPDIVIEVVSPGHEKRDYEEKPNDYLAAGVREYWIIDPQANRMTVLARRGDVWDRQVVPADGTYQTSLLPRFQLRLSKLPIARNG